MKMVILLLCFLPLITSCSVYNDGSNIAMPVTDNTDSGSVIISGDYSGEYWVSLNRSIYLEMAKINISFINFEKKSSDNIKVTIMVTYINGKDGVDLVEFNTNNPSLQYELHSLHATLQLLGVTTTNEKTKVKIKLTQYFYI